MDFAAIAALPLAERLRAMEIIWDSLCRDDAPEISPPWHTDVLRQRLLGGDASEFRRLDEVEAELRRELGFD
jgi:hypothetical protein